LTDAFGGILSTSGSFNAIGSYGGAYGYLDQPDNGIVLAGNRFYDPSIGRFLSRDPAKDGKNWYAYCENNPVSRYDSTGYWFETALDILGLFYDILEFSRDPSLANGLFIIWSGVSIAVPGVPGSWVARAAKAGAKYVGKRGKDLAKVLKGDFRERLIKFTKEVPFKGAQAHHIIPVALADQILDRFAKKFKGGEGALIEFLRNPSNGMWVDPELHRKNSYKYQKMLEEWLEKNPKGTLKEFYEYAVGLARELFLHPHQR
jgi:RHS repeat-associated protein